MNYFKHHIGDYAAATAHLTWEEDMAYTRLLRVYYQHEKAIPNDREMVYRLVRATTKTQKKSVDNVLQEFFSNSAIGWEQKRVQEELDRSSKISEANRLIAKERWGTKRIESVCEPSTGNLSDRIPSHKPIANSHKPIKNKGGDLVVLPDWLPADRWQEFVDHRSAMRKPMSGLAETRMVKHLQALRDRGHDALALMETAIRSGWQDVYEPRGDGRATTAAGNTLAVVGKTRTLL